MEFQSLVSNLPFVVNVKKFIAILALSALVILSAACSGGDATPTRTRVAQAEATQTPWIIYIPVTTTPGPELATLEPTTTPNAPPTNPPPPTRVPATPRPVEPTQPQQPTTPPESPTAEAPTATPAPSCGEPYQVTNLLFPENGALRRARPGSGAGATIQFKFEPVAAFEMDPRIGYRVNVSTPRNSQALYISHNAYLKEQVLILSQQATYGLTQGDDMNATWSVDVIMASGEFNDVGDDTQAPLGTIAVCGPTSPQFSIELVVEG